MVLSEQGSGDLNKGWDRNQESGIITGVGLNLCKLKKYALLYIV